jgi:hypothetical protein
VATAVRNRLSDPPEVIPLLLGGRRIRSSIAAVVERRWRHELIAAVILPAAATYPPQGYPNTMPFDLVLVIYSRGVECGAEPLVRGTGSILGALADIHIQVDVEGKTGSRWGEVEE